MARLTNFDIPDKPMSYREIFQDAIDSATARQKDFPVGSIAHQQYQIYIDVGKSMLEMIVDQDPTLQA